MSNVRHDSGRRPAVLSLTRILCIWATWVRVATPQLQAATDSDVALGGQTTARFGLIPSAPRPIGLIPSAPRTSLPPGLIPSAPRTSSIIPSDAPALEVPSSLPPEVITSTPGLVPSEPLITSSPQPTSFVPPLIPPSSAVETLRPSDGTQVSGIPDVSTTSTMPSKASTDEGLRPIPGPTTNPGDPDGHHEISEPNFTNTAPCKGCSPIIEITATGWDDFRTHPVAEPQETTQRPAETTEHPLENTKRPPEATILAGPSNILFRPAPTGNDFVIGDSTTVKPGQTVIVDNTPIVIQTSAGHPEVIVGGTQTVPFNAAPADTPPAHEITNPPVVLLPITIGAQTFTPIANTASHENSDSDSNSNHNVPALYKVDGQTLLPGGAAITVSGTTLSLDPSATILRINGRFTTLTPTQAVVYTTTSAFALTLGNTVITANRAGYYVITQGVTLIPGGAPVTYSGSVISLVPEGTAAVIQGSASHLQPVSTVVTVTKTGALGAGGGGGEVEVTSSAGPGGSLPYPSANSAGVDLGAGAFKGVYALLVLVGGWAAVWL